MGIYSDFSPLKLGIFHSYVKLPEGKMQVLGLYSEFWVRILRSHNPYLRLDCCHMICPESWFVPQRTTYLPYLLYLTYIYWNISSYICLDGMYQFEVPMLLYFVIPISIPFQIKNYVDRFMYIYIISTCMCICIIYIYRYAHIISVFIPYMWFEGYDYNHPGFGRCRKSITIGVGSSASLGEPFYSQPFTMIIPMK